MSGWKDARSLAPRHTATLFIPPHLPPSPARINGSQKANYPV